MRTRFILMLPLILIPVSFLVLGSDAAVFLIWWFALSAVGLVWWPLAAGIFPNADHGWLFAKGLGLAFSALSAFLLQHFSSFLFHRTALLLLLLITALIIWFFPYLSGRRVEGVPHYAGLRILRAADKDNAWFAIAFLELLFGCALLFWTFARGMKPELDSLEKFMNIGFINSIRRSESLPAADIWFSGTNINYYYFGHYVYAWLAKICSIKTTIAYQLGMASTFAMTAALSGSLVLHLLYKKPLVRNDLYESEKSNIPAWIGAALAAILVVLSGNSHSFWFDNKSPGNFLLRHLNIKKLNIGDPDKIFWFADSTRYIGYNPGTADKTIHEFPYYSFLVADLHAHLINLTFVLVLLGILVYLIRRPVSMRKLNLQKAGPVQAAGRIISDPAYYLLPLLLAVFMMANYWDFIIYFTLVSFVILVISLKTYTRKTGRIFNSLNHRDLVAFPAQIMLLMMIFLLVDSPLLSVLLLFIAFGVNFFLHYMSLGPLTWAGARVSWIFFFAHFAALPFNIGFEPIAKSISRTVQSTPAEQFFVLWGTHIVCGLIFFIFILSRQNKPKLRKIFPPPPDHESHAYMDHRSVRSSLSILLTKLGDSGSLVLSFYLMGLALLVLPEIFYVVDIYSGEFKRANTMFKFTYQAFVLLSIVWSFAVPRLFAVKNEARIRARLLAVILTILMVIPLWYPFAATSQWLGTFSRDRYNGLDAMNLLALKDSAQIEGNAPGELADDVAAIEWLNENINGQPVVLEAYGDSYTDYNRISVFTGLPTIIGWQTHEWLWRTSKNNPDAYTRFVVPRQNDVQEIYTTDDQNRRKTLLQQYNVDYIVTGALEHEKFSFVDEDGSKSSLVRYSQLLETGSVVFEKGNLSIIKVKY